MTTYQYSEVEVPEESAHILGGGVRVARINYMKAFGEAPPGWIIGYGRFEGKRFVMEDEIVARHLIIRNTCYGLIAYQTTPDGETVDRGWILVPYTRIELDGDVCIIT